VAALDGRVIRFIDDLRAAEAAGAEVFAVWIDVCRLEELRGGLRGIAAREAGHAALLANRLAELGAPCVATIGEAVLEQALGHFGSAAVSDEEKLALLLARYPDDAAVQRPILDVLEGLDDDPETQELLRLIADGERATVGWLRAYHAGAV
jgi:hypothetical protein